MCRYDSGHSVRSRADPPEGRDRYLCIQYYCRAVLGRRLRLDCAHVRYHFPSVPLDAKLIFDHKYGAGRDTS
jgi:hypothetical protein